MKILLDNGARGDNVGDISMQEGILARLQSDYPYAHFDVFCKSTLPHAGEGAVHTNIIRKPPEFRWLGWCQVPNGSRPKYRKAIVYGLYLIALILPWFSRHLFVRDINGLHEIDELSGGYDCLVLAGGGYLNTVFLHDLLFKLHLINVFLTAGKPVVLTGQQIGPIRSAVIGAIMGRYLRRVNFICLREGANSPRILKNLRVPQDKFKVIGDDSFGVEAAKCVAGESFLNHHKLMDQDFIAFNFRFAGYAVGRIDLLRRAGQILLSLQTLLRKRIVYFSIAHGENDSDAAAAGILLSEFPDLDLIVLSGAETDAASSIKYLLSHATLAIGVSYHFCTYAISEAVPTLCLYDGEYYGQKAWGLGDFWENPKIACPLDAPAVDIVEQAVSLMKGWNRIEWGKLSQMKRSIWEKGVSEVMCAALDKNDL